MAAPTIPYTIPGTVDQSRPEMVARLSFESAQNSDPLTWVDVSSRLRSFTIDRGGENELELIDTGTCAVVLDNRDRALDPFNTSSPYSPNVKPMRRLWLQSQWAGATHDQFYGWTGAFKPEWPAQGNDAVVSLTARDGFSVLAGDALPTTSPPRDSYPDVVLFDRPYLYWRLTEVTQAEGSAVTDSSENSRNGTGGVTPAQWPTPGQTGLITGSQETSTRFTLAAVSSLYTEWQGQAPHVGDFSAKRYVSVEALIRFTSAPSATAIILAGPTATNTAATLTSEQYLLMVDSTGHARFSVLRAAGAALDIALGGTVMQAGVVYHIAGVYDSVAGTVKVYLNGVQEASTAATGVLANSNSPLTAVVRVGGGSPPNADMQELALYDTALAAARVAAHYTAATSRGRAQELANNRIAALLEASGLSFVPRRLRTAARQVQPIYYSGQSPKGEVEEASRAEGDPSVVFFAKDGAVVFLDRAHRSASPWNTVQATFDDDGTDLPYRSLEIDDGEAFIYNDVRVTARGSTLQQSTDTASIAEYQRRVLDRGETLNINDTDADAEGDALLAKYKDPLARITALELTGGEPDVLTAFLAREIGDSIRVFRRPIGGGSTIDQTSFIRKITLSGDATSDIHWTCKWAVAKR